MIRKTVIRLLVIGLAGICWTLGAGVPCPARAGEPLVLVPGMDAFALAPVVDILEDPDGNMDITAARAAGDDLFLPHTGPVISIGRSASAFWFRFRLEDPNPAGTWFLEIGKSGIGAVDLYVPVPDVKGEISYSVMASGAWRPPGEGDIPSRTTVLALPHTWPQQAYFYLRVESSISINFPLTIRSPKNFIAASLPDLFGFGILFGVLLGMILYNLSIYLFLRDRAYLYYVLYMVSIFTYLTLLYGQFHLFFEPDQASQRRLFFLVCSTTWLFGAFFSRQFLNTRQNSPQLDKLIRLVMGGSLTALGTALAGYYHLAHQLNSLLGIAGPIVALAAAVTVWRKGFAPAKYFLAAWLVLMTGSILYSLGGIVIPRTPVTVYTFAVGAGVESILLSLALADRIRMLRREKEALSREEKRLRHEALTDGLTGLYNRRQLLESLEKETRTAHEQASSLSLIIMDVDNFKQFNDTWGHPQGDKVLVALAGILRRQVRDKDRACRYGGEEFVVLLPETGMEEALGVAERIRERFSGLRFDPAPDSPVRVTVSLGLAQLLSHETAHDLLNRADQALYRAKKSGKNRVENG